MQCARCHAYVSANIERCPKCGLKFLRPQKIENPAIETRNETKPTRVSPSLIALWWERLTHFWEERASTRIGAPLMAGIIVGIGLAFGVVGWGVREYRLRNAPPLNERQDAVTLVMRAPARSGGTVKSYTDAQIETLAKEEKVEKLPGWTSECVHPPKCTVKFAYKEKGESEFVAEWSVDVSLRTIRPENEPARQLTW